MKRGRKFVLLLLIPIVILLMGFILAVSYNIAPSTAGNGTNVSVLIFNVTANSTTGNTLANITVNLRGTANAGNITNVTLSTGSNVYYNTSSISFPLVIPIGTTLSNGVPTNYTLNFTISPTATDNLTIGANITAIATGGNITYDPLPYTSSNVTISSLAPSVSGLPTNNSNLSQTNISLNLSVTETASNISQISISIYNSTTFNSTFLVNNSINSSINQQSAIQVINSSNLPNGIYYANIFANDTFNHIYNQTFIINLDTLAPIVGGSCSPSTVYPGQTVTCSCSASGTYNSSTLTGSSTITSGGPGLYYYGCSATDYAGNIGNGSASYSVLGYSGPGYISPSNPSSSSSVQNNNTSTINNTGINANSSSVPQANNNSSNNQKGNIFSTIINFFKNLFKSIFG